MKQLLLEHKKCYPQMEIRDMVKLLYQSEFGGGHMILNPETSLKWLKEEYKSVEIIPQRPVFETIGGGLCRLYLNGDLLDLSLKAVNQMFVSTAEKVTGSTEKFEKSLDILRVLCRNGELSYSQSEVDTYLEEYKEQGYPAVSHSQAYRSVYKPAYRVVSEDYMKYYEVFRKIDGLLNQSDKELLLIAIDGKSGSGKSTLGYLLKEIYACNLFHADDFFLRPEQRTKDRLQEAGGNIDYERLKTEVIDSIYKQREFTYRPYDCSQQCLSEYVSVKPNRLNIIEGSYSQHPYFGSIYDLRFFIDIEETKQIERIQKRNGTFMLERFCNEWIPMENNYFETCKIKEQSFLVK